MSTLVAGCALGLFALNVAAIVSWALVYRPRLVVSTENGGGSDERSFGSLAAAITRVRTAAADGWGKLAQRTDPAVPPEAPSDDGRFATWLAEVEATEQAANLPATEPETRWRQWADRGATLPAAADSCRPQADR